MGGLYLTAKLVTTGLLWIVTLASTYIPWAIKKHFRQSLVIMSYCNCLAGGVIFGAMLLHVFPSLFKVSNGKEGPISYPLGSLFAGISFLLLLAIDRLFLSHSSCHMTIDIPNKDSPRSSSSIPTADTQALYQKLELGSIYQGNKDDEVINISKLNQPELSTPPLLYHHLIHCDNKTYPPINPSSLHSAEFYEDINKVGMEHSSDFHGFYSSKEPHQRKESMSSISSCKTTTATGIKKVRDDKATKMQAFIFVIALSLHSFLEGLGLSALSKEPELISYIIGLVSHKWLEAFALGITVYNAHYSKKLTFGLNLFYSSLTPLGILFGLLLVNEDITSYTQTLIVLIFNGLSVGSFLFVCCIEMIPPEFTIINRHSPFKFFCVVFGFSIMAAFALLED